MVRLIRMSVGRIISVAHPNPFQNRYLPIAYKIWDLGNDGRYLATQLVTWDSGKIVRT